MKAIAVIAIVLLLILIPTVVSADTSEYVVITANPAGNESCPSDFTITVVSLYEIELDWTPAVGGNTTGTTLIRAAYGRAPENTDDGFVVYNDSGNSTTHWINTEFIGVDVYYKVWAETDTGYTTCYAAGSITGGEAVAAIGSNIGLLAFLVFTAGMTISTYAIKRTVLAFIAAGAWAILAFYVFSMSESTSPIAITDIYMGLFWVSIAMVIVSAFEPVVMRDKEESEYAAEPEPGFDKDIRGEMDNIRSEMAVDIFKSRKRRSDRRLK